MFFFSSLFPGLTCSSKIKREMLKSSFKSYFSYVRGFYKFGHLQVRCGTKKGIFYAVSQGVAIADSQNIFDIFFVVHTKILLISTFFP